MTVGRTEAKSRQPSSEVGTWVALAVFGTNWGSAGGAFYDAAYRLLQDGTVELRGTIEIDGGAGGATPFTLPVEARPAKSVQSVIGGLESASGATRVFNVDTAGAATITSAPNTDGDSYSLDGIRFSLGV